MKKIFSSLLVISSVALLSFKGDKQELVDAHAISVFKNEGFNNSKVMETLWGLCEVNGPRLTGSTGMKNAEAWAKKQLEEAGMANVQIEPWGSFGKGWDIQKCYVAMKTPYYQTLIAVPKAWTSSTNGAISGDAMLVKIDNLKDMEKYAGKLHGKIVILNPANADTKVNFTADGKRMTDEELEKMKLDPHLEDAGNLNPKPKPAGSPNWTPPVLRKQIDSFMLQEGPALIISGGRGTMGTLFTSNGSQRAWDAPQVTPEVEIGAEHMNRMLRLMDGGVTVSLEADIKTNFLKVDSVENNVVAEIPGTDPALKDELVILGAHMDSWHGATGTTDNGAGSAVAMEALRIIKASGLKPRRTIRLVLWSGEEQGLLGSRGYVKNHFADRMTMELKADHKKVSAYYNLDNGAGKIRGIFMQGNDEVRPFFEAWLEPFKDLGASTLTIRNTGSTDHISFDEVGIPGFQFIQDPLEYGSRTHHTNMDTYDRVNNNDLMQASVVMATFVYETAMMDKKLPRKAMPAAQKK